MALRLLASEIQWSPEVQFCFGVRDGIYDTLRLLLGEEPDGIGEPYEGEVPDEIREWAQERISVIDTQKSEESEGYAGSFYELLLAEGR